MARRWRVNVWRRAIGLLLMAGIAAVAWWSWAMGPVSPSSKVELVNLQPGMAVPQLAQQLKEKNLIRSPWAFRVLVSQQKNPVTLFAGEYFLTPSMTPQEILAKLTSGPENAMIRITIPEGYTTAQIVDLLVRKGLGSKEEYDKVLAYEGFPYHFLQGLPGDIRRLDGFLFPDTYFLDKKTSPRAALDMMLKRFAKEVTPEAEVRLKEMNLSIRNWVTLASLVEKEAVKESDRPLIAGVFANRLKANMPLQSCATVQYVLGVTKPKLYEKDLKTPSPYNTYLHTGLPPGPIASPGHASLEAVIKAKKTDYYYFLAKSDGYHVFAKNYQEHLRNQKKYMD